MNKLMAERKARERALLMARLAAKWDQSQWLRDRLAARAAQDPDGPWAGLLAELQAQDGRSS